MTSQPQPADQLDDPSLSVLRPGQDGYEAECAGWNATVVHHPALVVLAAGPKDVQSAVRLAVANDLPIAVQATGHGAGLPADGAVLISTRRMTEITVDPASATATIGAGATWGDVVIAAARHGLAPLNGSTGQVGVVGYLAGGGLPVLGRRYGYAADSVRAFDLVTPDGEHRTVSPTEHADLFWAVRGGRGNFGVVTSVEIDLVAQERLYGGGLYFPGESTGSVLRTYLRWAAEQPRDMCSCAALLRFPDIPAIPAPMRGRFLVNIRIAYTGSTEDGERLTAPLRELGPVIDAVRDLPYVDVDTIYRDPKGRSGAAQRSTLLREVTGDDLDALADALTEVAGPGVAVPPGGLELRHLGGALADPPVHPSAVGHRDAGFQVFLATAVPAGRDDAVRAFQQSVLDRLAPWDTGAAVPGFLVPQDSTPDRVRRAYEPADYRRLTALKAEYDPANRFRFGHNIPPLAN